MFLQKRILQPTISIMRLITTFIIILCLANTSSQAARIYVTMGGSGTKSGNSWSNARQGEFTLNAIIASAVANDSLFIAEGKYLPTAIATNVSAAINLKTGVSLFGGFPQPSGSLLNPTWNQRNPNLYLSILSGDIDNDDWDSDNDPYTQIVDDMMGSNSNNVVVVPAGTATVVIDGFTISGGDAKNGNGGGIYSDYGAAITISNCRIMGNKGTQGGALYTLTNNTNSQVLSCIFSGNAANDGGAVYNHSNSKTAFRKCIFSENIAYNNGGAIFNNFSHTIVINNSVINNNTAAQGGGIYNNTSGIQIINDVLVGNNATNGAAVYNAASSTSIVNTTIAGNYSNSLGGGVLNSGNGMPKIKNSIFSGNTPTDISNVGTATSKLENSIVTIYNGGSCLTCPGNAGREDPQFINLNDPNGADDIWMTGDDGLRIKPGSLAINAGVNASVPSYITVDSKNAPRVKEVMVDLGAYEMLTFEGAGYVSTLSAANQATFANEECVDAMGWTHYYDTVSKKILLSIYKNGYNIGRINDGVFDVSIHTTANYGTGNGTAIAAPYAEDGDFVAMNRWWNVTPNPQLPSGNTGVKIRTYFTDQDSIDVNGSIPGVANDINIKALHFYKINDFSTSLNPDGNVNTNDAHADVYMANAYDMPGYWEYTYAEASSTDTWSLGKFNNVKYAEYEVAKFSGGGGGFSGANGQVFPVELLSFEVTERNGANRAVWITTKEENTQQFNVERSSDGFAYELLGTVLAAGNSVEKKTYDFTDFNAPSGNNYYRLRMIDNDGKFTYSNIVTVGSVNNTFTVYPNPATSVVFLEGEVLRNGSVAVMDITGKVVYEERFDNASVRNIDVSQWYKGLYIVKLYDETNVLAGTKKLVVQ